MLRVLIVILLGCSSISQPNQLVARKFEAVTVDTLLTTRMSCRAIAINRNRLWYGANNGRFGYIDLDTGAHQQKQFPIDSLDFRSVAVTTSDVFFMNAGSPAVILRYDKSDFAGESVYRNDNKESFFNSIRFWNNVEGIAMGDPTDGCLTILITRDGGDSWNRLTCEKLPPVVAGEAAFAASNTNIVVKGNRTWIVTGGQKARVFFSPDKGKSWTVFDTPIARGGPMTGIFSSDFFDSQTGIVGGGNYDQQKVRSERLAITTDGGKNWLLKGEGTGPGYISCVQFVPGSNGNGLVTVGKGGMYYSSNRGSNWKLLYENEALFTIRFQDDSTALAAGRNQIVRIRFKKEN